MLTLCRALFGAALVTLVAAAPADAADPPPSDFAGVYAENLLVSSGARREAVAERISQSGATVVRLPMYWSRIERRRGAYRFSAYVRAIMTAARHGITLLPVVRDPPPFSSSAPPPPSAKPGMYPPRDPREYARFAALLVRRYGPSGYWWARHPELPSAPIRAWQVWNEPTLPRFWASGPNPRQYRRLLNLAYSAMKAADPSVEVVSAGLPHSEGGMDSGLFLQRLYVGGRPLFDSLALHPYAPTPEGLVDFTWSMRRLLDGVGEQAKPLRITEFGWGTGGRPPRFVLSEDAQAAAIAQTLEALLAQREALRLRGLVYFAWRDQRPEFDPTSSWFSYAGLLRSDGSEKPGFLAFREAVHRLVRGVPAPQRAPQEGAATGPPCRLRDPARQFLAASLRRGIGITLVCTRPAEVELRATRGAQALSGVRTRAMPSGQVLIRFPVSGSGARLLRRRSVRVLVQGTSRDSTGRVDPLRRGVTIRNAAGPARPRTR